MTILYQVQRGVASIGIVISPVARGFNLLMTLTDNIVKTVDLPNRQVYGSLVAGLLNYTRLKSVIVRKPSAIP